MALFHNALICAAIAVLFWGVIGLSLVRWLPLPNVLRIPLAPTLGWATHGAISLPLLLVSGMTGMTVSIVSIIFIVAAAVSFWLQPASSNGHRADTRVPLWAFAAAAVFAGVVMLAILPRISDAGATLSAPVFDHAKVAMIDGMVRLGVPAINPFFGEAGGFHRLAYYYLWHFSAAEIAMVTGSSGWEADAGMTGYSAFSSLLLMTGFAVWLSSRAVSAGWALMLAATTSIRPVITALLGYQFVCTLVGKPTGFGTWLFQIFWAPQHVMSANCVLVAIFLLVRLARQPGPLPTVVLGLLAAAAYESSVWVGGVTFPLAAALIAPILLWQIEPRQRLGFAACLGAAGILAAALSAPFLIDQLKASALRADGFPIALMPYDILGIDAPAWVRQLLDVPAYWSIFLFVEFAAVYPAGLFAAARLSKDRGLTDEQRSTTRMLAALAVVALTVGGLLMSTIALNNDLAWRGVLPALLVLIALGAAGLGRYLRSLPAYAKALLVLPAGLALYDGLSNISSNLNVEPAPSAQRFLASTALWSAVRKQTGIDERVANNPMFLADITSWPINISWALLANRNSCYAGSDLALPFAPLTRQRRTDIEALFMRVFAGTTQPDDVDQLANRYDCAVVVLTPDDGAWTTDPFAGNGMYRMVESATMWRIYRRAKANI